MPTSTITPEGQTTVPQEVREALDLQPGDELTWQIRDGKVAVTGRPELLRWEGFIKGGSDDVVNDIAEARKRQGHI